MTITYNPSTNFGQKDALPINDPDKVIYGAEFTTEFNAIQTAFSSAAPTNSPTFTGTANFADISASGNISAGGWIAASGGDSTGWNNTKSTVDAGATGWDATKSTVDAGASNWDTAYGWGDHGAAGYTTTDTTYSAGDNISLSSTTFNLDTALTGMASADFSGAVDADSFVFAGYCGLRTASGSDIVPTDGSGSASSNTIDLGSSTYKFKDAHLQGTVDAGTVSIGSWEIKLDGNDLRFVYGGVDRFRITTAGALVAGGNITAYGSP